MAPAQPSLILVADDDRFMREALAMLLRGAGYRVESVADGQEALERLTRGGVSLLVLDLSLPRLSGLEVVRLSRGLELDGPVPVLVCSGRTEAESLVEALRAGADDYLEKPFDERVLLARVAARLRNRDQWLALRDGTPVARAVGPRPSTPESAREAGDADGPLPPPAAMNERLAELWRAAERTHQPLGLLLARVAQPDAGALRTLGTLLRRAARGHDVVGRASEQSVLALLPATRLVGVLALANRTVSEVSRGGVLRAALVVAVYPSRELREVGTALAALEAAATATPIEERSAVFVLAHHGYHYEPAGPEGPGEPGSTE